MKKKMIKGGHLPDKKCLEILDLFCDDRTATQIAEISGVSRVTINNYFRFIRTTIASFCEAEANVVQQFRLLPKKNLACDEVSGGPYFGLGFNNGKVTIDWLKDFRGLGLEEESDVGKGTFIPVPFSGYERHNAIADCSNWRLYRPFADKGFLSSSDLPSELTYFWNFVKRRLQKFRGTSKSTLYLHIRECEFRFNFRDDDMFRVLTDIISSGKRLNGIS